MEYEQNKKTGVPISPMLGSSVFRVCFGRHCQSGVVVGVTMEFLYLLVCK